MNVAAGELPPARAWAILTVASLGAFLGGAELMVVAIALPSIVLDFGGWADLARASWIVNAYLLAYVVAMPLAGRAADLWGTRRLYLGALTLFAVGSLAAGFSRPMGIDVLIAARAVQGFGGGALVPLSLSLAAHLFTGRARATAMGIEGAATFMGMAVGPAYGAWVLLGFAAPVLGISLASWQWIFVLNVPAALAIGLLLHFAGREVETPRRDGRIDVPGALLLSAGLVVLVWGVSATGETGWGDPRIVGALCGSALLLAAFWLRQRAESRRGTPLLDPRLLTEPGFVTANLISLLTGYTLATAIIGGPVFVSQVLLEGADRSAAALSALSLAIAFGAIAGGVLSGRIGERATTSTGIALSVAGLLLASGWGTAAEIGRLQRDLAVFGIGFGLTISPRATAALEVAGTAAYGVAAAMLQLTRTIGMSLGLALLTGIAQRRIEAVNSILSDPARRDALLETLQHHEFVGIDPGTSLPLLALLGEWSRGEAAAILRLVLVIALGVAVLTLVPALLIGRSGRRTAQGGVNGPVGR